jgi:hypothetical protein
VLADPFLETHALTDFQTIHAVITAVDMHENVSAAGVPLDESEASIVSVDFTTPVGILASDLTCFDRTRTCPPHLCRPSRGRVSQYPGRLVKLRHRPRILARSDRPETTHGENGQSSR